MFRYTLFTSFANRITGLVQSVGLMVLAYWLMAVAGGGAAYERAVSILSAPIFKLFYAVLLLAGWVVGRGIVLALLGAAFIYVYVALRGPRAGA